MADYKIPESVLVVIYCVTTKNVLMLQRKDDSGFWQSVTGSLDKGETPLQAAFREVKEETGIDIIEEKLSLIDIQYSVQFEIFPQFRHRYRDGVTHCTEHWYYLGLPMERQVCLSEHLEQRWLSAEDAANLTKSWNNQQAIRDFFQTVE